MCSPSSSSRPRRSGEVRAGDAERSALAERLSAHAAAGRLTLEELEERLGAAHAAVYARDLSALERDLPDLDASASPRGRGMSMWPVVLAALLAVFVPVSLWVGHPVGLAIVLALVAWRFASRHPANRWASGRGAL